MNESQEFYSQLKGLKYKDKTKCYEHEYEFGDCCFFEYFLRNLLEDNNFGSHRDCSGLDIRGVLNRYL